MRFYRFIQELYRISAKCQGVLAGLYTDSKACDICPVYHVLGPETLPVGLRRPKREAPLQPGQHGRQRDLNLLV